MKTLVDYTEAEIDALTEGRETDALVAEFVMGWVRGGQWVGSERFSVLRHPTDGTYWPNEFPEYSSDISAAWAIGERMRELGQVRYYAWALDRLILADAEERSEFMSDGEHHYALSQATPLQRCKAALKAVRLMKLLELNNA